MTSRVEGADVGPHVPLLQPRALCPGPWVTAVPSSVPRMPLLSKSPRQQTAYCPHTGLRWAS